jgi:hypothetical protein
MEIVVDGRTGLAPSDTDTFSALFETIRRNATSKRRVVVSMILDGEVLNAERQAGLAAQGPGGYGLLEVRTMDPFSFSLTALMGLMGHLQNMERIHAEAAAFVASGEYAKALEKFDACFHGWDILVRAVRDVASLTAADFRALQAAGRPVEDRLHEIHETILRFTAAMEFKDMARMAEILQGEMQPKLAVWRAVLEVLSQHVARLSGAAS